MAANGTSNGSSKFEYLSQATVPMVIGGKAVSGSSTYDLNDVHNPSKKLYKVACATEADVDAAIDAAEGARQAWVDTPMQARAAIFYKAANIFEQHQAELSKIYEEECSCSPDWAGFNIVTTIAGLRDTAGCAQLFRGEIVPASEPGKQILIDRVPYGVVFGIAPWNAAYILGFRAVRDAIMAGNPTIMKTSEFSPKTHLVIAEVFKLAGLPDGVLNLLHIAPADSPKLCERIIARREVGKVNFTGSTFVGAKIGEVCGRHIKPCVLELGGKAPFVVLPSANLDLAASGAIFGGLLHSGQICMSTDVVLVHESVEGEFHKHIAARAKQLTAGADAPLKGLFSERSAQRLDGYVKDALQKGAKVLAGQADVKGNVMQPLILAGIKDDMIVATEESFGPLITVRTFKDEAEAIKMANASDYGLSASVYGETDAAMRVARQIISGAVHINAMTVHDQGDLAHGGMKSSGFGRFNALQGLHEFSQTKVYTVQQPHAYPM